MKTHRRNLFLIIAAVVIGGNLLGSLISSVATGDFNHTFSLLAVFGIIAFILYRQKESFEKQRKMYLDRFEATQQHVDLRDAALFSLSWSREIYTNIPTDRKQLVRQAVILIAIGLGIEFLSVGYDDALIVVLTGLLVFAGVNLLLWVATTERSGKDQLAYELETARKIQLSLMPSAPPEFQGVEASGCCIPALNVGGDMFDYIRIDAPAPALAFAVADVAGKGMDAAMTAIFTSGALVAETNHESDPARIMNSLNGAIRSRNAKQRFVSLLLAIWRPDDGAMHIVNAGQSRPLLWRDGRVAVVETEGVHFPLGIVDAPRYSATRLPCRPGDVVLMYTDGVSEAMNGAKEVYGEERLQASFAELCARPGAAADIHQALFERVKAHAGTAEQHDDLTLIVVRINKTNYSAFSSDT